MRRLVAGIAAVAAFATVATACSVGNQEASSSVTVNPSASNEPVTITMWGAWTGREYKQWITIFDRFTEQYPWITVEPKGGIGDNKLTASINAGNPPDAVLSFGVDNVGKWCESGAWQDLNQFIGDEDPAVGVDMGATFPAGALAYTSYEGIQCALPFMTDTYGLYFNNDLVEKAGLDPTSPPQTTDELVDWAKKMTEFNADGSIKTLGFLPTSNGYCGWCIPNLVFAHAFGATWLDDQGQAAFASDPRWVEMYDWQKELIDFYGWDNLDRFAASLGDEWGAKHDFYSGKIAMYVDGEWRNAFIADAAPDMNYGTAPFPVSPDNAEAAGSGIAGGTVIGIPKGSPHPAEAWLLVRWMATDTDTLVYMTNIINNVPTTFAALESPDLQVSDQFRVFLDIFQNEHSDYVPTTIIGGELQDYIGNFAGEWQAGDTTDLQGGLQTAAEETDTALQQAQL
jgi:multiple sugar transport system substrate-binding protein